MKTLVFDTETTDLIKNQLSPLSKQPQIVEFFGLSLEDGVEVGTFHWLFSTGKPLPEITTRITGIKNEDLIGKPLFEDLSFIIKQLIEDHDEVVAHNMSFDQGMIDIEMKRASLTVDWPQLICTVEATEFLLGYRLNLSALHETLFGDKFEGAHRAEADVRALARCFTELRKRGEI